MMILSQYHRFELDTINIYSVRVLSSRDVKMILYLCMQVVTLAVYVYSLVVM
jgi:hypothetical protein